MRLPWTATVVRTDRDLDLALLRAVTNDPLPSLPLGAAETITELMDVIAFGFPLGRALSPDGKEYPAISVNAGSVSALRHKDGNLLRVQIDVNVTFGNSGGPVLDSGGRVVGVVVSSVAVRGVVVNAPGAGANMAIPVSHVARFLRAPDIDFRPSELTRAALDRPLEFQARVTSVVPGLPEPTVRLTLRAGDEAARAFPMTRREGVWIATATPRAKPPGRRVEIVARLGTGLVTGVIDDAVLKVGGNPVRLSGLRRIDLRAKPGAVQTDGKAVEGEVVGLGPVDVLVGDETVKLDLRKASQIQVQPAAELSAVTAAVVAALDGKDIGRVEVTIPVREAGERRADPAAVAIAPPALAERRVVKNLPATAADICVGGGGRYLVLHLPKLKKLAVFDVTAAAIVRYIPVAEDNVAFAAGLDSLVVGLCPQGVVERWNLHTGEKELTRTVPNAADVTRVLMGAASYGPVVVNDAVCNLDTLRPLPVKVANGLPPPWSPVAADGTVFGGWKYQYSPGESSTFVLQGDELKRYNDSEFGHVVPGPDGRAVYTAKGVVSQQFKRTGALPANGGYCIPAVQGNYYLTLGSAEGDKGGTVAVHLLGVDQPLVKDAGVAHGVRFDGWDRTTFGPWKRIFFIPPAKLIVVFPESNDRLELYPVDVDAALDRSGVDYLFVASQPPRVAKAGEAFRYAVAVKAKHGPATVKLDAGPVGMAVANDGVVTWAVPGDAAAGDHDIILTVRDVRGQEAFHTFSLRVAK